MISTAYVVSPPVLLTQEGFAPAPALVSKRAVLSQALPAPPYAPVVETTKNEPFGEKSTSRM